AAKTSQCSRGGNDAHESRLRRALCPLGNGVYVRTQAETPRLRRAGFLHRPGARWWRSSGNGVEVAAGRHVMLGRASNVSHTVVLRPLKAGYFNFTSATITYLAQEGAQVVVGFTSAPGQGGILAQRDFDRRFSPHFLDWAAFGVMTLPSIGIPLLLWYSSKRKYDTPKTKKN
uniref:Translocon-associated protein subunit beta n=1 Tax=Cyanoderma ruficeps TaxID=181631 RepID=A0A8C3NYN2_9PASS